MKKGTLAKVFGGLPIGISLITTLVGLISILFPLEDFGVEIHSSLGKIIMFGLVLASVLALLISLAGYYLLGALGKISYSIIIKISTIGALGLSLFLIFNTKFVLRAAFRNPLGIIFGLTLILIFLSPIIFTILALVGKKVSIWKRFVPLISWVLALLIPITVGILAYLLTSSLGEDNLVYRGIKNATFPQWFNLGTIAWILVGSIPFTENNNEALTNRVMRWETFGRRDYQLSKDGFAQVAGSRSPQWSIQR